jgi:hypothetical protein
LVARDLFIDLPVRSVLGFFFLLPIYLSAQIHPYYGALIGALLSILLHGYYNAAKLSDGWRRQMDSPYFLVRVKARIWKFVFEKMPVASVVAPIGKTAPAEEEMARAVLAIAQAMTGRNPQGSAFADSIAQLVTDRVLDLDSIRGKRIISSFGQMILDEKFEASHFYKALSRLIVDGVKNGTIQADELGILFQQLAVFRFDQHHLAEIADDVLENRDITLILQEREDFLKLRALYELMDSRHWLNIIVHPSLQSEVASEVSALKERFGAEKKGNFSDVRIIPHFPGLFGARGQLLLKNLDQWFTVRQLRGLEETLLVVPEGLAIEVGGIPEDKLRLFELAFINRLLQGSVMTGADLLRIDHVAHLFARQA